MRNIKNILIVLVSFITVVIISCANSTQSATQSTQIPKLGIPIDCQLGENCFIMHYVDRDSSEEAVDFGCGRQTYDGHKGTDFAISDLGVMNEGVSVLASTPGIVLRVRDGIDDELVNTQEKKKAVAGKECGNGVVIDNGSGWETQYCHLRKGSIVVKPGMKVDTGTELGLVGSSGLSSFPHVHISVRHENKIIDPFVGDNPTTGNCQIDRNSLWKDSFKYTPTGLVRAGFSPKPPENIEIWSGLYKEKTLSANSDALIFWVHSYGVLKGDVEKWELISPNGKEVINEKKSIDKSNRSWVSFVGKRNFSPGVWRGKYELSRNNKTIFTVVKEVNVI